VPERRVRVARQQALLSLPARFFVAPSVIVIVPGCRGVHTVYIVLSSGGPAPYLSLHYFTFG
jgi:hypothetical protein